MRRPTAVRRLVQRLLLALVTVAASFVYLNRAPAFGGLSGMTTPGLASDMNDMPGMERVERTPAPADARPAAHPAAHPPADLTHVTRASPQTSPAPNAPPAAPHDHAAHCPFCFTAAFALEADGPAVRVRAGPPGWPPLDAYVWPHVLVTRHVHARAPPT